MASSDSETAEKVRDWFIDEGFITEDKSVEEFIDDGPYCLGCHGDRMNHWSPACWILRCCVDEKGLNDCGVCTDFPCDNLVKWSTENDSYSIALERLKS